MHVTTVTLELRISGFDGVSEVHCVKLTARWGT